MDFAVLVAVALFATVFASVIFGKEMDEKEKKAIAKGLLTIRTPEGVFETDFDK